MSYISKHIHIVVLDEYGQIRHKQWYGDFLESRDPKITAATYGNSLLDILTQEALITKDLELNYIITNNPNADAARIVGSLAEVLVVNYCKTKPVINRVLARYARFGERDNKTLDNYVAIGTGSKITQKEYPQHYQPHDTQRDVIWVDKNDSSRQLPCIGGTINSVKTAGLQIKVSYDGRRYITPNISNYFYPILYFDLNDDWHLVKKDLAEKGISAVLIHPNEIMPEIKDQIKAYSDIVVSIIKEEFSIKKLIKIAQDEKNSPLICAIAASNPSYDRTIIIDDTANTRANPGVV